MFKNKNKSEPIKLMKKVAIVTVMMMVGITIGVLISGNNKAVKQLQEAVVKGGSSGHYIPAPSGSVAQGANGSSSVIVPRVAVGAQPSATLAAELAAAPYDLIPQHQQAYLDELRNAYVTNDVPQAQANFEA